MASLFDGLVGADGTTEASTTPAPSTPSSSSSLFSGIAPVGGSTTPAAPSSTALVASTPAPKSTGGMFSGFLNFAGNALNAVGKAITPPTHGGNNATENTLAYLPSELARAIPGVAQLQDDSANINEDAVAPKLYPEIQANGTALTTEKASLDADQSKVDPTDQASVDAFNARVAKYNSDATAYQKNVGVYNDAAQADVVGNRTGNTGITQYINPDTISTGIGKGIENYGENFAGAVASYPIGELTNVAAGVQQIFGHAPTASITIPELGTITNDQAQALQKVQAGENPWQAALDEAPDAIFRTLAFVGIIDALGGARVVKTAETQGELPEDSPVQPGPKTGRLYNAPLASTPAYILPDEIVSKIKSQGIELGSKFDKTLPTFFRVVGKGGTKTNLEVMQLKPSYLRSAYTKIFGTETPPATVPAMLGLSGSVADPKANAQLESIAAAAKPSEVTTLHSQTVNTDEFKNAITSKAKSVTPIKAAPLTPAAPIKPTMAETVSHNILRLGNGDVSQAKAGAQVLQADIKGHLANEGEQMTSVGLQKNIGVDAPTATRLINEVKPAPVLQKPSVFSAIEPKAQDSSTGSPSNISDAMSLPETGNSLPSLSSTAERLSADSRYTSPMYSTVLDRAGESIPSYTTTAIEHSKANAEPFKNDIRKATGLEPELDIKKPGSIALKAERMKEKGTPLARMNDILRSRLVVPEKDRQSVMEKIQSHFDVIGTGDYRTKESDLGYKGINMTVKLPNGMPAEIQIHSPESLAQSKFAHSIYEKYRNSDPATFNEEQAEEYKNDVQTARNFKPAPRGFINPGALVDEVAQRATQVKDYIDHSQKTTELTGTVTDAIYQHEGGRKAMRQRAIQLLENQGKQLTAEQWETLYHHDEDSKVPLTPEEESIYNEVILPIKKALTDARTEYRDLGGVITTDLAQEMTPRYAKEKGGPLDRAILQAKTALTRNKSDTGTIANGGLLSKSVGSGAKHRVFHNATDEEGNRHVIAIKAKRVTAFEAGKPHALGPLNSVSKASLLAKKIAPIRTQLTNLRKEIRILSDVKVGTTGIEAKLRNLEDKALAISSDLMDTSMSHEPEMDQKNAKKLRALMHDIKLLSKVKPSESIILRSARIKTLEEKMFNASQEMLEAENDVPNEELNDRVFVDKDGKTYTIGQATTKEIEANTDTRYHKNALANYVLAYDRTTNALSALKLLDRLQNTPEFQDLITKQSPDEVPPEGWKDLSGVLPQFRGYYAEPKLAEALEDLAARMKGHDPIPVIDAVNNLLTTLIVANPIMHVPNLVAGNLMAQTADGVIPGITPGSAKNFMRAVNEVKNRGPLYLHYLEHGAPFMAIKQTAKDFTDAVLTQYGVALEKETADDTALAKTLGYANPAAWAKAAGNLNHSMTWGTNDILFMHALLDYADKNGSTPEEAIREVSKRMADYRLPSRIGPGTFGRFLSKTAQSRAFLFSRYHYSGVIKPWVESIKDTAAPGSTPKQRLAGARALAYLAIMGLVVYPYIKKMLDGLTGNSLTYLTMAGPNKLTQNVEKLAQTGASGVPAFAEGTLTTSPAVTAAIEMGFNVDLYTRDPIYSNPQNEGLGGFTTSMVAPLATGNRLTPGDFALSLLGIYTPKSSTGKLALEAQKYDELPLLESQVKKDIAAGLNDKATAEMKDFNDRAIANYNNAQLETGGTPLPANGSQTDEFLKEYGIHSPGEKAVANSAALYGDGSLTAKSSLVSKVATYAEAIGTDPVTAFNRIFTGQTIVKVDNASPLSPDSAIIVQRAPLATTEAIRSKQAAAEGKTDQLDGLQLDHFIPLEAGGSNDESNLDLVTTEQNETLHTPVESAITSALKAGTISRAKAEEYLVRFKIGTLGEVPNQKYIDLYKNEYNSQPITLDQINAEIAAGKAK